MNIIIQCQNLLFTSQDLNENRLKANSILNDKDEIMDVITTFFNTGKTKNLAPLSAIQLNDQRYSSFSDIPPLDLKDYATTFALQQLRFVSISDYEYEIKNMRVDLFDSSAIATFLVTQTGIVVDNYSFRGQHMSMESRGTFVLVKSPKWRIAHIHLSKIS